MRSPFLLLTTLALLGCGSNLHNKSARPTILGNKCGIAEQGSAPLIVDWSSGDRARLEGRFKEGVLAVVVSGCSLKPLWQCSTTKNYTYTPSSQRTETEHIADATTLYAKLPTTAVSLEAKLNSQTEIQVTKATVGRFVATGGQLSQADFSGDCQSATHYVSAVAVGAFRLALGEQQQAGGSVGVPGLGTGAKTSSEREMLSSEGNLDVCAKATEALQTPPVGCAAPIQIELAPVLRSLTDEEFRALLEKGSLEVNEACRRFGILGGGGTGLYVTIEPSGRVAAEWYDTQTAGHFFGTSANTCILETWRKQRVHSFGGPPLYGEALIFIDQNAPRDCNNEPGCSDRREHVRNYYRNAQPLKILTQEDAKRVHYVGPLSPPAK